MTALHDPFWFRCSVVRVIDGDTIIADLALGFYLSSILHIRLLDVDTPELRGTSIEERGRAVAAADYTKRWLQEHAAHNPTHPARPFWLRTEKADSFGRWLGRLECGGEPSRSLNNDLVLDRHAMPAKSVRGTW